MVASSPMQRCRKPPTLAFAYISPARSSKRRMRSIFWRTVRQVSSSGRSCLTSPKPISLRPTTSSGLVPPLPPSPFPPCWAPSPDCVASLVAIGSEGTHRVLGSIAIPLERGGAELVPDTAGNTRRPLGGEQRREPSADTRRAADGEHVAPPGRPAQPHPLEATPRGGRKPRLRDDRRRRRAGRRRRRWGRLL